jgi:hypothetical protein
MGSGASKSEVKYFYVPTAYYHHSPMTEKHEWKNVYIPVNTKKIRYDGGPNKKYYEKTYAYIYFNKVTKNVVGVPILDGKYISEQISTPEEMLFALKYYMNYGCHVVCSCSQSIDVYSEKYMKFISNTCSHHIPGDDNTIGRINHLVYDHIYDMFTSEEWNMILSDSKLRSDYQYLWKQTSRRIYKKSLKKLKGNKCKPWLHRAYNFAKFKNEYMEYGFISFKYGTGSNAEYMTVDNLISVILNRHDNENITKKYRQKLIRFRSDLDSQSDD